MIMTPKSKTTCTACRKSPCRNKAKCRARNPLEYDFDLIVLGGGSGGISAAREAADLGAKVALLNYVAPTPSGTTWDIGGTCVNVGCTPKNLMYYAAFLGEAIYDSRFSGWEVDSNISHNWTELIKAIQDHIKSRNKGIKRELCEKGVVYINAKGYFKDPHTIVTKTDENEDQITGRYILIAVGSRPQYPNVPGAKEYAITTDDLFSLEKSPGKTLIVGAGYVGVECAGFLKGLGYDVTVLNRTSTALRKFDEGMTKFILHEMAERGIQLFHNCEVKSITKSEKLKVTWKNEENKQFTEEFDTVLLAIGRRPSTKDLSLKKAGVRILKESDKIETTNEQTNVPHIFAVGDVLHDKPELTAVAIRAGQLLARRLFGASKEIMDYDIVGVSLFTPLGYGAVGLSEKEAVKKFGEDELEIYHSYYIPSQYILPKRSVGHCYLKVVAMREGNQKILGMHFLGPNAGECMQGFMTAMKCGLTMESLLSTVGIHVTNAEEFTKLEITKRSGLDPNLAACCS